MSVIFAFGALLELISVLLEIKNGNDCLMEFGHMILRLCLLGFLQIGCINLKRVTNDKKKLPRIIPIVFIIIAIIAFSICLYDYVILLNG